MRSRISFKASITKFSDIVDVPIEYDCAESTITRSIPFFAKYSILNKIMNIRKLSLNSYHFSSKPSLVKQITDFISIDERNYNQRASYNLKMTKNDESYR